LPAREAPVLERFASTGYIRKSNLIVLRGVGEADPQGSAAASTAAANRDLNATTAVASGLVSAGSAAVAVGAVLTQVAGDGDERLREAPLQGDEADACGECGHFTLVRDGTCMKCATCGSTSGCS